VLDLSNIPFLSVCHLLFDGGFTANLTRLSIQSHTGIKIDKEKQSFTPSTAFYTAVIYTVISLIVTAIYL
jgi:hypothetical protein